MPPTEFTFSDLSKAAPLQSPIKEPSLRVLRFTTPFALGPFQAADEIDAYNGSILDGVALGVGLRILRNPLPSGARYVAFLADIYAGWRVRRLA